MHPYKNAPPYAKWSKAMAGVVEVDPVVGFPFTITPKDKIVTAGSCFAQHIARHLTQAGFNHFVAEPAHPIISRDQAREHNYGIFSARYANIYTTRQLRQLFERALGQFTPKEAAWTHAGRWVDPFRPTIQPGGFHTVRELEADRVHHLSCVRRAMEQANYFVFTLGLTEAWESAEDGAVFPLCPGVEGGEFDASRHRFHNFTVGEVVEDMQQAIALLRQLNPDVCIILTVSPVPLAATALDRHVLTSTTISKATLRLAAETLCAETANVAYFPSYEIVTGPHARGRYFGEDLRSVTETGVAHVMGLFFKHATTGTELPAQPAPAQDVETAQMDEIAEALCEEAMLDR